MDSEHQVPAELRHLVQSISLTIGTAGDPVTVAPDTATELVFCEHGGAAVTGPRTRAGYHVGEPVPRVVMRLQPGRTRLLLGQTAKELVDRVVPLPWAGIDLAGVLDGQLSDLLLSRMAARSRHEVARSDLAHHAATVLTQDTGISVTARRLHLSERQLRTIFTDTVGISPKHFTRIDRLRAVLAGAGQSSWSDLAVAAGYYDQAHLTVEFRTIMGVPPAAFVSGRLPSATLCTVNP
jgi:AraC-like DNA-binding protein